MTADIKEIKNLPPSDALIEQLEVLLSNAKNGSLRSIFTICSWDNGSISHGWTYSRELSRRKMLAEMVLLQHEFIIDTEFAENDTVLARRFDEWE